MAALSPGSARNPPDPVREALTANKGLFGVAFAFSAAMSVLALTVSLYMLQVYDRVLSSRSEETLLLLTIIAFIALTVFGMLDSLRLAPPDPHRHALRREFGRPRLARHGDDRIPRFQRRAPGPPRHRHDPQLRGFGGVRHTARCAVPVSVSHRALDARSDLFRDRAHRRRAPRRHRAWPTNT